MTPQQSQDCWNRIGVEGDKSCPKLKTHIHCRNCPAFQQAAHVLLDRAAPDGYVREWTELFAGEKDAVESFTDSAIVFRLGSEWLALPASLCVEVVSRRPVRRVPHRTNSILLGLTSVRGELLLCFSLARLLGLEPTAQDDPGPAPRMLVASRDRFKPAFPVDEVQGIHRFDMASLENIPATVSHAMPRFSRGVIPVNGLGVGLLDDAIVFESLAKELA